MALVAVLKNQGTENAKKNEEIAKATNDQFIEQHLNNIQFKSRFPTNGDNETFEYFLELDDFLFEHVTKVPENRLLEKVIETLPGWAKNEYMQYRRNEYEQKKSEIERTNARFADSLPVQVPSIRDYIANNQSTFESFKMFVFERNRPQLNQFKISTLLHGVFPQPKEKPSRVAKRLRDIWSFIERVQKCQEKMGERVTRLSDTEKMLSLEYTFRINAESTERIIRKMQEKYCQYMDNGGDQKSAIEVMQFCATKLDQKIVPKSLQKQTFVEYFWNKNPLKVTYPLPKLGSTATESNSASYWKNKSERYKQKGQKLKERNKKYQKQKDDFRKQIPCRFGKNCRNLKQGSCPYKHDAVQLTAPSKFKGNCFKCNESGHKANDCPKPKVTKSDNFNKYDPKNKVNSDFVKEQQTVMAMKDDESGNDEEDEDGICCQSDTDSPISSFSE